MAAKCIFTISDNNKFVSQYGPLLNYGYKNVRLISVINNESIGLIYRLAVVNENLVR